MFFEFANKKKKKNHKTNKITINYNKLTTFS